MPNMGNRIYQKRKENNLTMEELGKRLGVNKTAVCKWEKGIVTNIRIETAVKMAAIFNCSPGWLLFGEDEG